MKKNKCIRDLIGVLADAMAGAEVVLNLRKYSGWSFQEGIALKGRYYVKPQPMGVKARGWGE